MIKIIFMRHGQSEANRDNIFQGLMDSPLTDLGRSQAREMAQKLRDEKIEKIYSSHLSRAFDTAAIIREELDLPYEVTVWSELREIGFSKLSGKSQGEIFPAKKWSFIEEARRILNGEADKSFDRYLTEGASFFEKVRAQRFQKILVVSHGSSLSKFFAFLEGIDRDSFLNFAEKWDFKNSELRQIEIECGEVT